MNPSQSPSIVELRLLFCPYSCFSRFWAALPIFPPNFWPYIIWAGSRLNLGSARSIKREPRQLVPGINSDTFLAAISDRAGVHLEEDQADARLGQQDEGIDPPEAREVSMPPDRLVTQVRSDTLKRVYVTRGLGKKYGPTPGCPVGCATIGSHHHASHSDTCRAHRTGEE